MASDLPTYLPPSRTFQSVVMMPSMAWLITLPRMVMTTILSRLGEWAGSTIRKENE